MQPVRTPPALTGAYKRYRYKFVWRDSKPMRW